MNLMNLVRISAERLVVVVAILALAAFLAFGALAQEGDNTDSKSKTATMDLICSLADDYGQCVQQWVGEVRGK